MFTVAPLHGDYFCFIGHDISYLKNLESQIRMAKDHLEGIVLERTKELHEALEVKSRFLAIMSHGSFFVCKMPKLIV